MKKEYAIGLDIGSASVGWAVTDERGKLIRIKGKRAMGSRLFEMAQSAADRRVHRATRRRLQRRKQRILWLQEIMAQEVAKKDKDFYKKLEATKYQKEDSAGYKGDFNLFNDVQYTDIHFHKEYPTIYHLRKHLMECNEQVDIRLVYLALHHILKYRGHFLFGESEFKAESTDVVKAHVFELFNQELFKSFGFDENRLDDFLHIAKKSGISPTQRKEELLTLFNEPKNKQLKELITAIVGNQADYTVILQDENLELEDKPLKFALKNNDKLEQCENVLSDYLEIYDMISSIYSWITLQNILSGMTSISEAMIYKYEVHKQQLKELKELLKGNTEDYDAVFKTRGKNVGIYEKYLHQNKYEYDAFKKDIKSILMKYNRSDLLELLNADAYLLKQNTKDNSQIPYQLHLKELIAIVEKQSRYYPSLDISALSTLLKYRIPYYVGPLNHPKEQATFAWAVRKEEGAITPWNIKEKIDYDASAEKFIKRMTNKCTYLYGKDVLPKNSLLYKKYMVLNELNQLKIIMKNGSYSKLNRSEKEMIINDLFKNKKTVTVKDLMSYAPLMNHYDLVETIQGFSDEGKFANNLSSYIDFKEYLDRNLLTIKDVERIIEWLTVFEDHEIVKRKLTKEFEQLSQRQIKKICNLKYSGWGRLSKELLQDLKTPIDGHTSSIMDILMDETKVFMQIINDDAYTFKKQIEESFVVDQDVLHYEHIKELAGSPAIKKGIWQSILIVKEIVSIMGYEPKHIFIEMAREEGKKKRTKSRKAKLEQLYKEASDISKELKDELAAIDDKSMTERLYLYFIQQGKCLYSGKKLELSELSGKLYEVDHILPRSLVKDDSLENKALVYATYNQEKGGNKLVSDLSITGATKGWWSYLLEHKFIGAKKFNNLTRTSLSKNDIAGFIQRQLVETRQITKHVVQILQQGYPEVHIGLIRANLSHDFRSEFDFPKVREVNQHHHAFDAFISIQLGLFIMNRFPKLNAEILYKAYTKFDKNKLKNNGFIINAMTQGYTVERTRKCISFEDIMQYANQAYRLPEVLVTKKLEESSGDFYNQLIVKKKENAISLGLNKFTGKAMDTAVYGGYEGEQIQYSVIVKKEKKTKKATKISFELVGIPTRIVALKKQNEKVIEEYLQEQIGDYEMVNDKVMKYQLFKVGGHPYRLASTSEWHNAKELHLDKELQRNIKNKQNLDTVFEHLCLQLKQKYEIFSGIANKMENNKSIELFKKLSNEEKLQVIINLLKVVSTTAENGNLKLVGLTEREGRLGSKTTVCTDWTFVKESVTGLYTKEYTL